MFWTVAHRVQHAQMRIPMALQYRYRSAARRYIPRLLSRLLHGHWVLRLVTGARLIGKAVC
ncbi:hypothetical protein BFP70_05060 [Thioclava sp. SK-1]|nr:hypothetical protein BFP70_05060 [Thioclava sp. SK-1]